MRGSLTIEASVIVPLLLFMFLFVIRTGIEFYEESEETVVLLWEKEPIDVLKIFFETRMGESVEDGNSLY